MQKISLLSIIVILTVAPVYSDKNAFSFIVSDSFFNYESLVKKSDCNNQFDNSHPASFEPNKTFLTFYGDSLGDFVDEPLYGYFGWDKYLTMMNFGVEP
ncbi:hypothetical protein EHQ30_04200 [Leptospira brenneri]|uniref:Uncharacterized protein n=1 Tax=Leptospira brenneri TaxID=2023182 RepID=A0A2M9Y6L9_9LEPT|nr:hypothetical protein CH361_02335 [Leptospira brenneri]TGK95838.1 hypothetical protein EHQ30_04200 [Leptospira brenneri]